MLKFLKGPFFRIVVSLIAIFLIGYSMREHLKESVHILKTDVKWSWFVYAISGYMGVQAVMAFRLYLLYKSQNLEIPYLKTLYLCIVGLFFNLFLPSAVGGDVAKIYYTYKYTGKKIEAATAVVLDRLVGFVIVIGIALFATLGLKGELNSPYIHFIVYLFLGVLSVILLFFFNPKVAAKLSILKSLIPSEKIKAKLTELYSAISSVRHQKKILTGCLLTSGLGQLILITVYYWIAMSLNVDIEYNVFFLLVPLISIASMAPSLGGLGVREAGAIYFFSFYMDPERALAHSLLLDIVIYGLALISGGIYALGGGLKAKPFQAVEVGNVQGN